MIVHTKFTVGDNTLEFEIDTSKVHPMIEKNKDSLYQIVFTPPLEHPTFEMESSVFLQDDGRWFWAPYFSPEDYYVSSRYATKEEAAKEFVECEVMSDKSWISYAIVPITIKELIMITEERYKHAAALGKCKIIQQ